MSKKSRNRLANRLLLAAAVPISAALVLVPALGQEPPAGPPPAEINQLLALPPINLTAAPQAISQQLDAHRAQLALIEQTLAAGVANAELEAAAVQLRARIVILEAFAQPLPTLDLQQNLEGLRVQLTTMQSLLQAYQSLGAQAEAAALGGDAAAAISQRVAAIEDGIAQLQTAIEAAEAAAAAPEPEPAPAPEPAPRPEPEPAPAPEPAPPPEPAPAPAAEQPAPPPDAGAAQFDAVAVLQGLPPLDLASGEASAQQQLTLHEGLLAEANAARAGVGDNQAMLELVVELEMRIRILSVFAQPLPPIDTTVDAEQRRAQIAQLAGVRGAFQTLADEARAEDRRDAVAALDARVAVVGELIAQLEQTLVPALPAEAGPPPEAAAAPAEPPEPPPAEAPPAEAPPAAAEEAPAPPAEPMPADLDQQIAAFIGQELAPLALDVEPPALRAQLDANVALRTEGETLLGQGRIAGEDVIALAERMAELQRRISALEQRIAEIEGRAVADEAPADIVEQLVAAGEDEEARQVGALRERLLDGLLQLGVGLLAGQIAPQAPGLPPQQPPPPPPPQFGVIVGVEGDRVVFLQGDEYQVRRTPTEEMDRLLYQAQDVEVVDLGGGYTQTTIYRADGSRVVTVTDQFGQVADRRRIEADGTEIILIQDPGQQVAVGPPIRFEDILPPLQIVIPQQEYIVEADRVTGDQMFAALVAPPVEPIERIYSLNEVRYSERLRDKMRRIDLTTITFAFGSAAIGPDQFQALTDIGRAIEAILAVSPYEVFLIEGHADAVGTDYNNLILSDRRAETIAVVLSQNFDIPPENLVTQGYGEQFLKVPTLGPERQNRRGVVLRITPLLVGPGAG